ncbi:STAS domain-containing protein [Nocardioides conyzicola]
MNLFSALALHSPHAHLVLKGELDAFSAIRLQDRLDEAVSSGCFSFDVDLDAVSFVDAGGLSLLVRLRNSVMPHGGAVSVVAASGRFRKVARIAGLGHAFDLHLLPDDSAAPRLESVG